MVVHHCSSCTARQQELNRLKSRVRKLEKELAFLHGPQKLVELTPDSVCAACGHIHQKTMTRHHRVPLRIRWKIPHAARTEVLGDEPEIINLCEKCHHFIEGVSSGSNTTKPLQPCTDPIGKLATVPGYGS